MENLSRCFHPNEGGNEWDLLKWGSAFSVYHKWFVSLNGWLQLFLSLALTCALCHTQFMKILGTESPPLSLSSPPRALIIYSYPLIFYNFNLFWMLIHQGVSTSNQSGEEKRFLKTATGGVVTVLHVRILISLKMKSTNRRQMRVRCLLFRSQAHDRSRYLTAAEQLMLYLEGGTFFNKLEWISLTLIKTFQGACANRHTQTHTHTHTCLQCWVPLSLLCSTFFFYSSVILEHVSV